LIRCASPPESLKLAWANSTFGRPCGRGLEDACVAPTRCTSSYRSDAAIHPGNALTAVVPCWPNQLSSHGLLVPIRESRCRRCRSHSVDRNDKPSIRLVNHLALYIIV
jgi:hypothetical protein